VLTEVKWRPEKKGASDLKKRFPVRQFAIADCSWSGETLRSREGRPEMADSDDELEWVEDENVRRARKIIAGFDCSLVKFQLEGVWSVWVYIRHEPAPNEVAVGADMDEGTAIRNAIQKAEQLLKRRLR
jgi:hypothetical protein